MEKITIHLGSLQPTAKVAYWVKTQQDGSRRRPLAAHGAQGAVRARPVASARGMARDSMVWRWFIGDKVFTLAILMDPTMNRNT
jgi:hypothetical protein